MKKILFSLISFAALAAPAQIIAHGTGSPITNANLRSTWYTKWRVTSVTNVDPIPQPLFSYSGTSITPDFSTAS